MNTRWIEFCEARGMRLQARLCRCERDAVEVDDEDVTRLYVREILKNCHTHSHSKVFFAP